MSLPNPQPDTLEKYMNRMDLGEIKGRTEQKHHARVSKLFGILSDTTGQVRVTPTDSKTMQKKYGRGYETVRTRKTLAYQKYSMLREKIKNISAEQQVRLFLLVVYYEGLSTDDGNVILRPLVKSSFDLGNLFV